MEIWIIIFLILGIVLLLVLIAWYVSLKSDIGGLFNSLEGLF